MRLGGWGPDLSSDIFTTASLVSHDLASPVEPTNLTGNRRPDATNFLDGLGEIVMGPPILKLEGDECRATPLLSIKTRIPKSGNSHGERMSLKFGYSPEPFVHWLPYCGIGAQQIGMTDNDYAGFGFSHCTYYNEGVV